jgi:hypothetical protein
MTAPAWVGVVAPSALTTILVAPTEPKPERLPESNDSVKTIRALEEQLRSHVAVKGIEQ